ncbi:GerAB/ArcD/ProY family transporter [Rossellomorea marisflavi]|uniref:Spore gernimation protein GerB n=1 Tax=Rossellomorea marisflavi TaxID=189381 RepID=A0A163MRK2_9BACI|nr:GerAB/ArcD/ProY family transporter [Rossellomorea marisflavi]KZE53247.1 spore gernimation protein GerB [Rossellomorea marisflavi]TYO69733.1 GerAB/ArcD/ProY family transporter [Rossellomorea marisflavi]
MQPVPENRKISPGLVFFLVHSIQVGTGVLGFQRIISMHAGYDGWMSVILAGMLTHVIMFLMYKMLGTVKGDLVSIHTYVFGKWIGHFFSFLYALYFSLLVITIIRSYVEVVQVWMYPRLSTFLFSLFFLLLAYYIISGGVRTIAGVSYLGTLLPSYLVLTFVFTFKYADFRNLLPVFDHSVMDILLSTRDMSLTYLGYESILMFYPFIKDPERSQKFAQWGLFLTTSIYTVIAIISFGFFAPAQLDKTIWATLSMWKIVEMPFVERFEYIGIANWCLIILPNVCITLWCASRVVKRMTPIKHRHTLILIAVLCLCALTFIDKRDQVNVLNTISGQTGFYFNFLYIPLLFVLVYIAKKVKKQ